MEYRPDQQPADPPQTVAPDGGVPQATLAEAQREAIFARRAAELAALPALGAPGDVESSDVLAVVFALGGERYAFASSQVREVRPVGAITPLPGAPSFVAGLLNLRGRIVPVLDLRPLFGLAVADAAREVLILSGPRGDTGILTTSRPIIRPVGEALDHGLAALPAGAPPGLRAAYVRGVTPDFVVVLDAEQLLMDQRLLVQEER